MTGRHPKDLWAITCYFNPMHYRRRLANFRIFRDHLQLPLVAVELAYGPEFELQAQDAEILIQLRDGGGAVAEGALAQCSPASTSERLS